MAANWLDANAGGRNWPAMPTAFYVRGSLKLSPRQPGAVDRCRHPTPIAAAEDRRIQNIDCFVVETFEDRAGKVIAGIDDQLDRPRLAGNCTRSTENNRPGASSTVDQAGLSAGDSPG